MRPEAYPASYYAATANPSPERPALAGETTCDVCVVGGGYTGLSAALHLAERGYRVVLLEANRVGWGASGRNGGQMGSGQRMAPSAMVRGFGAAAAKRLWDFAEEAKAIVRKRIADHDIACELKSGHLSVAAKPGDVDWLKRELEVVQERFGYRQSRFVPKAELGRYLGSERYHGGVFDEGGGHLHPLNYALGLADAAAAAGARLYEGTPALSLTNGARPAVRCEGGSVRAEAIVLACNGYLGRLEPRIAGAILPINNYVIATARLGPRAAEVIPADCCVHDTRFVVDYYRLSGDGRLLFGGGETYRGRGPRDIAAFVRPYMLRVFPGLADVPIDYGWGGTLAITRNRLPHFGRLSGDVYFAHGFSGHGVALTALAGKLIAEAVAGTTERFDVFAGLPHRDFPGGTLLRRPAAILGMLYYALRDRL